MTEWIMNTLTKDRYSKRNLRFIKYIACMLILFVFFCQKYWNLLSLFKLPSVPLFDFKLRNCLHSNMGFILFLWLIYSFFCPIL